MFCDGQNQCFFNLFIRMNQNTILLLEVLALQITLLIGALKTKPCESKL
jgi:hypothetical protein